MAIPALPPLSWFKTKKEKLFYIGLFIVLNLLSFFGGQFSVKNNNVLGLDAETTQNCGDTYIEESIPNALPNESRSKCVTHAFSKDNWNTKRFIQADEGFWCPKEVFEDPVLWLKKGVSLGFTKFKIEYELEEALVTFDNPQSFVLEFARKKDKDKIPSDEVVMPIYKLWLPEGEGRQLFRFSKNTDYTIESNEPSKVLTPEEAFSLSAPVKIGQTDVLTIEPTGREGKELYLNFIYSYTADDLDKGLKDTVSKTIKLPLSNAYESKELFYYGVGTFKGTCIRPISYTICDSVY